MCRLDGIDYCIQGDRMKKKKQQSDQEDRREINRQ